MSGGASGVRPSMVVAAPASAPVVRSSARASGSGGAGASTVSASAFGEFSTSLIYPDPAGPDVKSAEGIAATTITLAEFQNGRWVPIMSAPAQDYGGARAATFRGVPPGRMVLPMYASGAAAANPWAISPSGQARELKGPCATCPSDEPAVLTVEIIPAAMGGASERAAHDPASSNIGAGVIAVRAAPGRRYTLLYWDRAWLPVGEVTVGNEKTRIEGVPSKRVLWLRDDSGAGHLTLPVVR